MSKRLQEQTVACTTDHPNTHTLSLTLNIHHTRGDENKPYFSFLSYTTTWCPFEIPICSQHTQEASNTASHTHTHPYPPDMLLKDLWGWQHVIQTGAFVTDIINIKENRFLYPFLIELNFTPITARLQVPRGCGKNIIRVRTGYRWFNLPSTTRMFLSPLISCFLSHTLLTKLEVIVELGLGSKAGSKVVVKINLRMLIVFCCLYGNSGTFLTSIKEDCQDERSWWQ